MSLKNLSEVEKIIGNEGTIIKQLFHPHNTLDGIRFSIAHFTLQKGKQSTKHQLKSSEVYYFLGGEGKMHIDENEHIIKKDSIVFVPPMAIQFVENLGDKDLLFLCIVDPAWKQEDEVLVG